ncbi:Hypothetical predicted protein [Marmota monax]|uniref:Uncharacterized protein n=1 Tax=Marmota monax TaxID=9995 RepID=A0A5E4C082_MARMO|nr:hypothetical protein GHT09_001987 [Marmota monax]VTJ74272.1 Hypothetical predicted protein [Marmota monax]
MERPSRVPKLLEGSAFPRNYSPGLSKRHCEYTEKNTYLLQGQEGFRYGSY